jgi:hypothetical protein
MRGMTRIVIARPPKRIREPGWPRIRRAVGREPLTALERRQAAEWLAPGRTPSRTDRQPAPGRGVVPV